MEDFVAPTRDDVSFKHQAVSNTSTRDAEFFKSQTQDIRKMIDVPTLDWIDYSSGWIAWIRL